MELSRRLRALVYFYLQSRCLAPTLYSHAKMRYRGHWSPSLSGWTTEGQHQNQQKPGDLLPVGQETTATVALWNGDPVGHGGYVPRYITRQRSALQRARATRPLEPITRPRPDTHSLRTPRRSTYT
ncbi:unnamed protein product [Pieris brassicae]|uniref:Uncharacterized protein n=1 Tax=Pieris brassicae TaxID=7116 RepID=A0A9P0TPA0_PIEBR|nr:unnamed protein product [Pieris brassicae]